MTRARTPRDDRRHLPERERWKVALPRDVLDGVVIDDPERCWRAKKGTNSSGYTNLHRLVASLFMDVSDKEVHHLCGIRTCVNPDHLVAIPTAEHAKTRMKSHCLNGHDMGDQEIMRWYRGRRWCRVCDRDRRRRYRAARKVA